jgi:RNA polymerase primary sigma factor
MINRNVESSSYFRRTQVKHSFSKKEEANIFKSFWAEEKKLYRKILSYQGLGSVLVDELIILFSVQKEDTKSISKNLNTLKKYYLGKIKSLKTFNKAVDNLINEFHLLDSPKKWVKSILEKYSSEYTEEIIEGSILHWFNDIKDHHFRFMKMKSSFIESNIGLVASIVKKYQSSKVTTFSFTDYLQEGCFGLLRAIDKFDYRKGFKFSTYASWWVKHSITRAFQDKERIIRIPVHLTDKISLLNKIKYEYYKDYGVMPTVEYLAKKSKTTSEFVSEMLQITNVSSLDAPIKGLDNQDLYDVVSDCNSDAAEKHVETSEVKEKLEEALKLLSPREEKILRSRFGLLSVEESKTLKDIGDGMDLSRERIRQVEVQALSKLKKSLEKQKIYQVSDISI